MDKEPNLLKPLLVAAGLFLCLVIVGCFDYEEALISDAIRKDPPKLSQTYIPPSLIIPYDASICQNTKPGQKDKCRWYVSSTTRKEIR